MKYRLKDKELQRKLDEISNGDFSVQLQKVSDDMLSSLTGPSVNFGGLARVVDDRFRNLAPRFSFRFHKDEVEEVPQYDPTKWNEWPDVEPPEKTLLRIEIITERIGEGTPEPSGGKVRCRGCATYSHGFWMLGEKITVKPRETVRFRPWDDTTAPTKSTLNKKILQEIIKALESHPEAYDLGYLIDDVSEAANELPDEKSEK